MEHTANKRAIPTIQPTRHSAGATHLSPRRNYQPHSPPWKGGEGPGSPQNHVEADRHQRSGHGCALKLREAKEDEQKKSHCITRSHSGVVVLPVCPSYNRRCGPISRPTGVYPSRFIVSPVLLITKLPIRNCRCLSPAALL